MILVINCGGSSIKYQVINISASRQPLAKGLVENIGSGQSLLRHFPAGTVSIERELGKISHAEGLQSILKILVDPEYGIITDYRDILAVGHRVVHAGEKFRGSVLIDEQVLNALNGCVELAPLHNPANIMGIKACQELMPDTPQVAVFDNAFHSGLPDYAYLYGLPYEYYEKYGVRRYGFHGISFAYMTSRAAEILGRNLQENRVVSLMLGSGCTANALAFGRSIDVSTGFTPLEGLIQSTRAGDVDAAAITYIMRKEGFTPEEMDDVLNRKSGWLGISGISNDLRLVEEAAEKGNYRAGLAIEAIAYRAKKYIGAYAAAMSGLDFLVFSGGVGEKSVLIRKQICQGLEFLGIQLDQKLNTNLEGEGLISMDDSPVPVLVVGANEELVIARESWELLQKIEGRSAT